MKHMIQLAMAVAATCVACNLTAAQQFRIESTIYADQDERPVSDNLTLFDGGKVYDFMLVTSEPTKVTEIAIYDAQQQSFTLLDTTRHLRLELRQSDLEQMLRSLTSSESFQQEFKFLIEPKMVAEYDAGGKLLELRSDHIHYKVLGEVTQDESTLTSYFNFIDAYTLLNATDPRKLPPFARMKLNQALREHRLIPARVEMVLEIPGAQGLGNTRIRAASTHSLTSTVTEQDRQRMAQADRFQSEYKPTTLGAYRKLDSQQTARRD